MCTHFFLGYMHRRYSHLLSWLMSPDSKIDAFKNLAHNLPIWSFCLCFCFKEWFVLFIVGSTSIVADFKCLSSVIFDVEDRTVCLSEAGDLLKKYDLNAMFRKPLLKAHECSDCVTSGHLPFDEVMIVRILLVSGSVQAVWRPVRILNIGSPFFPPFFGILP